MAHSPVLSLFALRLTRRSKQLLHNAACLLYIIQLVSGLYRGRAVLNPVATTLDFWRSTDFRSRHPFAVDSALQSLHCRNELERQNIALWRRDDTGHALQSSSEHDAFQEMVLAKGLGGGGQGLPRARARRLPRAGSGCDRSSQQEPAARAPLVVVAMPIVDAFPTPVRPSARKIGGSHTLRGRVTPDSLVKRRIVVDLFLCCAPASPTISFPA